MLFTLLFPPPTVSSAGPHPLLLDEDSVPRSVSVYSKVAFFPSAWAGRATRVNNAAPAMVFMAFVPPMLVIERRKCATTLAWVRGLLHSLPGQIDSLRLSGFAPRAFRSTFRKQGRLTAAWGDAPARGFWARR